MEDYISLLHWAFFAAALLIAVVTEFIKRLLKFYPQNKTLKLLAPTRLVPAVLGLLLGLVPNVPAPEIVGGDVAGVGHMLYFAMAGILSMWVYGLVQKIFEDYLPDNLKKFIASKFKQNPPNDPPNDDASG